MKNEAKTKGQIMHAPGQTHRGKTETQAAYTVSANSADWGRTDFEILIVDDDRELAANLQEILAGEGYRPTVAYTGQDAMHFCSNKAFDLAIVDIRLPDTSGVNLVERLAKTAPDMEAIFITGYASLDTAIQAAGRRRIIGYQTKPLDMDAFLALIRQVRRRQRAEEAVMRSEEYFRSVIENAPDMFVILNADGSVRYVSPASERLHGYRTGELIGEDPFWVIHPDDLEMAATTFSELLEKPGQPFYRQARIRHKDGSWRHIELTAKNLLDNPAVEGIIINYRDITERKRTEEALRASEERFRTIFENANDGILHIDQSGTIIDVNSKLEETSGFSRDELVGKSFTELPIMTPDTTATMLALFHQAMETGEAPSRLEFEAVHKDGYPISIEASLRLLAAGGEIAGALAVARDISERKRAEELLRESEEKYRILVDNTGTPIAYLTPDGYVLLANRVSAGNLGRTPEELVGKSLREILPELADRTERRIERILETGNGAEFEDLIRLGSGHRWFVSNFQPVKDAGGQTFAIQIVSHDITDRKMAEEALRHSMEHFRALIENAPDMVVLAGPDGTLKYASPSVERVHGYSSRDLIGANGLGMVHPDDVPRVRQAFAEVLENPGRSITMEAQVRQKDGAWRWVEFTGTSLLDHPAVEGLVVNYRDITERKQAECLTRIQRDLGQALSTADNLNEALAQCIDMAIEASGMDCGGAYIVDRESGQFDLVYSTGLTPEFVEHVSRFGLDSHNGRLVMAGNPIYARYGELGFEEDEARRAEALSSIAIIPIAHEKKIIACLNIASHSLGEISLTSRNILESIAAQIGGAIARLKAEEELHHYRDQLEQLVRDRTVELTVANEALGREIMERRRAEEALRESEERYRLVAQNTDDLIGVSDADGNYTYVSPSHRKLGYEPADLLGTPGYELVHPDDRKRVMSMYRSVIRDEGKDLNRTTFPVSMEFRIRDVWGNWHDVETASNLVPATGDASPSMVHVARDISERKRAEEALRREKEKFQVLAEKSPLALAIIENDGRYSYLNPKFVEVFGYTLEDIPTGKDWFEKAYPDPEFRQRVVDLWVADLRQHGVGASRPREFVVTCKDGSLKDIRFLPVAMETGRQFVIYEDITERKQAEQDLRKSEEQFRTIFENANDEIVYLDKNGIVLDVNRKVEDIFGYTPEEVIGHHVAHAGVFEPADSEKLQQLFEEVVAGRPARMMELKARRKDGSTVFVETSNNVIRKGDEIEGILTIVRDITERKMAEEALRKSEEEFRRLLENASDTIGYMDEHGNVIDVNRRVKEMFGYEPEEVIGRNFVDFDILDPEQMRDVIGQYRGIVERETTELASFEARRKDGSRVFVEASTRRIKRDDGTKRVLAIIRDITERKRTEQALRESEERYRLLVENVNDAIFSLDTNGNFTYISPVVERLGGYGTDEILGKPFSDFIHPDDLPQLSDSLELTLAGNMQPAEFRVIHKDGSIRHVRTSSRLLMDGERVVGLTGVMADVTHRKRAEELFITLAHNSQIGTYIVQDGKFQFTNPALQRDLGYSEQELQGVSSLSIVHPEAREKVRESAVKMLKGETSTGYEFRIIAKDGTTRWAYEKVASIEYRGRPATLASYMDITDRKQQQEKILQANRELATLNAIAQTLSQSLDLDEILRNALDKIAEILSIENVMVALLDSDREHFTLRASRGINRRAVPHWKIGEGVLGHVAETGESLFVDSLPDPAGLMSEQGVKAARRYGVRSMMYVPLQARGQTLGVMASITTGSRVFSPEERQLLITIGHQISTAIENAILYRELRHKEEIRRDGLRMAILAQEDERRRIARELHDQTSQVLTGASAMIEASVAALPEDYENVKETLKHARLSLTHMLFDVRNIIYELRPTMLDDLGLVAAARWHAEEFLGRAGILAHFETKGRKRKLSRPVETALFRIIQEATTNIVKHAGANNVTIRLEYSKDWLTLHIIDDGKGFDLQSALNPRDGKRGLGLVSMKERTEILNGTFTVESKPGKGTHTVIKIPMR